MIIIIPIGLIVTLIKACIRSCEEQHARARAQREYEQIVVQEEPHVTIQPPTAPYQQMAPYTNVPPPPSSMNVPPPPSSMNVPLPPSSMNIPPPPSSMNIPPPPYTVI